MLKLSDHRIRIMFPDAHQELKWLLYREKEAILLFIGLKLNPVKLTVQHKFERELILACIRHTVVMVDL